MPQVLPFAGLRYPAAPDELERLVSPPYDVIGPGEQAQLRQVSAHNVSYVELPEDAAGQPGSRYALAANLLHAWRRQGVLHLDPRPTYYLAETHYAYTGQPRRRRDLLAAVGVEPWSTGAILPHEHTMSAPKADRLELLRATHLNSSPIWLLHRERFPALDAAWAAASTRPPDIDFSWRSEQHRVWMVTDAGAVQAIQTDFQRGGPLYIADGHHRYETSLAFRAEAEARVPGAKATLAAITWAEDPGMLVLPTHRLLHGLTAPLSLETLTARWLNLFEATYFPLSGAPEQRVDVVMRELANSGRRSPSFAVYAQGDLDGLMILALRQGAASDAALPADRSAAWKSLDVSLLHSVLVDPLIAESGRPREEVLSFTRDAAEAVARVREGRASVALFLNPTPVAGVLAVADAHDRMPEKSTYFHPKPPAGLVMRDLDVAS